MPWECFVIEQDRPITEYVVGCAAKHRTVVKACAVTFRLAADAPAGGWPTECPECGVELVYDQGFDAGWRSKVGGWLWLRPDTGERHRNQHSFGPGAMFDGSEWAPKEWCGEDGKSWWVVLPPGGQVDIWHIDGPASSGGHWTRTGVAPKLTASPSILTPNYHGFLQDGVLTDSLPDRPLP